MKFDVDTDDIDRLARRRAKSKLGWFIHAAAYVLVNLLLIALSLARGKDWALFPLLGWGAGLALHGMAVWLFAPGGDMLEGMVERERTRLEDARKERR